MQTIEIKILRTRTVTIDESAVVSVEVPDSVVDDDDALYEWVENRLKTNEEFSKEVDKEMEADSEDTDIELHEVNNLT